MTDELHGRVAVVTGVSGQLGGVWTEALTSAGARVLGLDIAEKPPEHLTDTLDPAVFRYARADVTDRAALDAAVQRCRDLGWRPSILVNNAGLDAPPGADAGHHLFSEFPDEVSEAIMGVNALGTLRCCQAFGPELVAAGGGSVINIGSLYLAVAPDPGFYAHLAGDTPFLKPPAYGMSKAAVHSLTTFLAAHWGPRGVRVNTLSPGGVRGGQDATFVAAFTARVPLGRMASHDDLTGPLLFLASDRSRYVTGTELRVDGGFQCW